jgi:hypothetical protein
MRLRAICPGAWVLQWWAWVRQTGAQCLIDNIPSSATVLQLLCGASWVWWYGPGSIFRIEIKYTPNIVTMSTRNKLAHVRQPHSERWQCHGRELTCATQQSGSAVQCLYTIPSRMACSDSRGGQRPCPATWWQTSHERVRVTIFYCSQPTSKHTQIIHRFII